MKPKTYATLLAELAEAYRQHAPKSAAIQAQAEAYLVDGGSHALRLMEPFPPRIVRAQGAWLEDEDGHQILDFWQGHLANILGHNPRVITAPLAQALEEGMGLQTGFADRLQVETAEILCQQTGAEQARFTTSGSLATMYAIMLARAFTARTTVIKVGGGWHGAQPWGLKGITYHDGYQQVDSEGLPQAIGDEVVVTRFNDPQRLGDHFHKYGDRVACFIVEPVLGAGGLIPATREYLLQARRLTEQYGALLIFDEVITGFRFGAGDAGAQYGIKPDLAVFGKIIGGGMPLAAVAGRAEVLELAGRASGQRVKFSGGTYSGHPACLLAGKVLLSYLVAHEPEIYPRLAALGEQTRRILETSFSDEGLLARCTGHGGEALPGSSMAMVHFPYRADIALDSPDVVFNPGVCNVALSQQLLQLALLLENVQITHAHGVVSAAHTEEDLAWLEQACRAAARRIKPFL